MLDKENSVKILNTFYSDCHVFHLKNGTGNPHELAYRNVKDVTTNPFEPNGEKLDEGVLIELQTKNIFM